MYHLVHVSEGICAVFLNELSGRFPPLHTQCGEVGVLLTMAQCNIQLLEGIWVFCLFVLDIKNTVCCSACTPIIPQNRQQSWKFCLVTVP